MNRERLAPIVILLAAGAVVLAFGVWHYAAHRSTKPRLNIQMAKSANTNPNSSTIDTASLPVPASTAGVNVPRNSFISPDHQWIAFENGLVGNNFPADTETVGEVDIVSSDRSIIKAFTPAQLGVSATCDCEVSILGWGKEVLWLENDPDEEGAINGFVAISTSDWSALSYRSNVSNISFRSAINLDTGEFVITDLPWGPLNDSGLTSPSATTTYSVSVYDIRTGKSQIIETTTAQLAAPVQTTFGLDLMWMTDNILQYYDFQSHTLATSSVSI